VSVQGCLALVCFKQISVDSLCKDRGLVGIAFGIPVVIVGQIGVVPIPTIFRASAMLTFLALIPLLMIKRKPVQDGLI